VSLDSVDISLK